MIIGVIIQVTSWWDQVQLAQFMVGRVITGVGNGMNTATIPTYQAECSKPHKRGLHICVEGGTVAIGTLISYWIDYGIHWLKPGRPHDDVVWRFPIAFQIVFGVIIIVGIYLLPESPRWLLSKDRISEGEYVIAALEDRDIEDPDVQREKNLAIESIQA